MPAAFQPYSILTTILLTAFLLFSGITFSQSDVQAGGEEDEFQEIEILEADYLQGLRVDAQDVKILVGNVILKQEGTLLYCDSAFLYSGTNNVKAFGNVHINQGDTVKAWGDSLTYRGDQQLARLMGDVVLTDSEMELWTEDLDYNLKTRLARYRKGGRFDNKETVLTSTYGYYYAIPQISYFRDSVVLIHPSYVLEADTLEYHVQSDIAYFHGPTNIYHENNSVYCEGGSYNGQTEMAIFTKNAVLIEPPQSISGDSIVYDRQAGFGRAWFGVRYVDTVEKIIQESEYAEYYESTGTVLSTERTVLTYIMDGDSLYISGDTIQSSTDSLGNRILLADGDVRVYKSDMQLICDSMMWKDSDSSIYLYDNPILWAEGSQFTGDTIIVRMKRRKLNSIELLYNAFIVSNPDTLIFNQIKGRYIYGNFRDDELRRLKVVGNGQSIYYAEDEGNGYFGMNEALCSNIFVRFENKKVDRISFLREPEATFHKMEGLNNESFRLEGFSWRVDKQPKSKEDLLAKRGLIILSEDAPVRGKSEAKSDEVEAPAVIPDQDSDL